MNSLTQLAAAEPAAALLALQARLRTVVETYSNVHRGTGQYSLVTTALYERARDIILSHVGLSSKQHVVIFCSPRRAIRLQAQLEPESYRVVSSNDLGLPLGVRALVVQKKSLSKSTAADTGGGTVKIASPNSVIWADAPDRFEAGTPSVINVIAIAMALQLANRFGHDIFRKQSCAKLTAEQVLYHDEFSTLQGAPLLRALRSAVMGHSILVPSTGGVSTYTNLDNGASTPTFVPVWNTVCRAWQQSKAVQQDIVRQVRQLCANFLGAPAHKYDVLFTSNTTEAINIAASHLKGSCPTDIQPVVLNTWLEHNSNELPWRHVPGASLVRLSVDAEGFVDLDELARLLREYNFEQQHGQQRITLVAVSGASNVLGTFNDLAEISRLAHQYGACVLVDAAQMAAHRRIEMAKWGIDYLACSGHKLYAPFGTGALVVRKGLLSLDASERQALMAAGDENVAGIAALGKALNLLQRIGMDVIEAEEKRLTLRALHSLTTMTDVAVYGATDPHSPKFRNRSSIIAFSLNRVPHNLVARELAERGAIGVRSGCHCAHLLVKRLLGIHPLRAKAADLGLLLFPEFTSVILPGVVRVSFGITNDQRDIEHLVKTVRDIANAPRSWFDRLLAATHNGTPFLPRTSVQDRVDALIEAIVERVYSPAGLEPTRVFAVETRQPTMLATHESITVTQDRGRAAVPREIRAHVPATVGVHDAREIRRHG